MENIPKIKVSKTKLTGLIGKTPQGQKLATVSYSGVNIVISLVSFFKRMGGYDNLEGQYFDILITTPLGSFRLNEPIYMNTVTGINVPPIREYDLPDIKKQMTKGIKEAKKMLIKNRVVNTLY